MQSTLLPVRRLLPYLTRDTAITRHASCVLLRKSRLLRTLAPTTSNVSPSLQTPCNGLIAPPHRVPWCALTSSVPSRRIASPSAHVDSTTNNNDNNITASRRAGGVASGSAQKQTREVTNPSALQQASGRELVLSPPALIVTREYEWANLLIGFEQANRYSIRAAPGGEIVGYLAEVSDTRKCA